MKLRHLILVLVLLFPSVLRAQLSGQPKTQILTSDPSGGCANGAMAVNITNFTSWVCNSGWKQLGMASGAVTGGPFVLNQFVLGNSGQGIKTVAPTLGPFTQD